MGKGGLTEADKNYGGIYAGIASDPAAKEYVETADCVLRIGNVPVSYLDQTDSKR